MNDIALTVSAEALPPQAAVQTHSWPASARAVLRLLAHARQGTLSVRFPDGQRACFGRGLPIAEISLRNFEVFAAVLRSGDIGFAETYARGDWDSPDPTQVLQFVLYNRAALERVVHGSFWGSLTYRLRHRLRRNSRAQATRNIMAHYDLGNEFYALWLDESMTYSAALFAPGAVEGLATHQPATAEELQQAQRAKYQRVIDELALAPGARVLEIGCGWGGFAETAAAAGLAVTGLTLSPAQLACARQRLGQRLSNGSPGPQLHLRDYRDEQGMYDGIASIEMFEAVGEAHWQDYFRTLRRCLRPGGRACIQSIVIDDRHFDRYRGSTDFIQQYVFPGGMLPSSGAFRALAQRHGFAVQREFAFGRHYARTLATWRARFLQQAPAVAAQGFDAQFRRLWSFYLAYCEAAFAEGSIDVVQYTLVRNE